jgi:hypothetical protein
MSKTPTKEMIEAAQEAYATFGQVGHLRAQPPAESVVAAMLSAALQSAADTPPDIDQVATRIASKYLTLDISCERLYHDVVEALTAERAGASRKAAADIPTPTGHPIEFRISITGSDGCQTVLSHWPEGYALERHGEIVWREEIKPEPREDRL